MPENNMAHNGSYMNNKWKQSKLYRSFHWLNGFRKRHRKLVNGVGLLLFFILVWPLNFLGMAPVWSWPVTVQVVDAETDAALPEVVAVAVWPSETGTLAGGTYRWGTIRRMETQSNDKGFFHLSGWMRVGFRNWISETGPKIYLYKAGYWPRTLKNNLNKFDEIILWPEPWISDWNGKVVKLEPMHWREWTKEEWEKQHKRQSYEKLRILPINNHDRDWPPNNCKWKRRPKDFLEGMRYFLRMVEMLPRSYKLIKSTPDELKKIEKDCGENPYRYLKQYGMTDKEWKACCELQTKNQRKK